MLLPTPEGPVGRGGRDAREPQLPPKRRQQADGEFSSRAISET